MGGGLRGTVDVVLGDPRRDTHADSLRARGGGAREFVQQAQQALTDPRRRELAEIVEAQRLAQSRLIELRHDRKNTVRAADAPHRASQHRRVLEPVLQERCDLLAGAKPEILPKRHEVADLRIEQQIAEHRVHPIAIEICDHRNTAAPGVQDLRGDGVELALHRSQRRPQRDQPNVADGVHRMQQVWVVERLERQLLHWPPARFVHLAPAHRAILARRGARMAIRPTLPTAVRHTPVAEQRERGSDSARTQRGGEQS